MISGHATTHVEHLAGYHKLLGKTIYYALNGFIQMP